jgi:mannitol-1-/sugar-/sorbitol-6-/2-deoxyglucose-6-phosphatase
MDGVLKAVIFDMDGVLIDSEHLWRKAMILGFKQAGIYLSEDDCRKTMGLRIGEVIEIWLERFKVRHKTIKEVENEIMQILINLIETEGKFIPGIPELLAFCTQNQLKTGLATSSSELLMTTVLQKLELGDAFHATLSAERLKFGKPHPEVFLNCAEKLSVNPMECLVIEDSLNGIIAAKSARMKVIAVPDEEHRTQKEFIVADYQRHDMHEVLALFKTLFPHPLQITPNN